MTDPTKLLGAVPQVATPKDDIYYDATKRFVILGGVGAGLGAAVFGAVRVFSDWQWLAVADALTFFLVIGGTLFMIVVSIGGWRTFALLEARLEQYEKDSETARLVREASVNFVVVGDKNKVSVNSPQQIDGRTVVLKVQQHQKLVEHHQPPAPVPEVMPPDYLDWMIATMLETGELSRAEWMRKSDPSGNPISRSVWEAVIDALYETDCITGDRTAKRKQFRVKDISEITARLAARYPDGIVLRENGFPVLTDGK